MASLSVHFNSFIRRCLTLLPAKLGMNLLTRLDLAQKHVEPEIVLVPGLMSRRRTAIDIGSNNGVTTMVLARHFQKVEAFEPNPLLASRVAPGLPAHARLRQLALSDSTGEAELRIPVCSGVALAGWASLDTPQVGDAALWQRVKVEKRTLDSFDFQEVDLIKIDVEGHEMAVLEGARNTIQRHRPWMIVEVWEPGRPAAQTYMAGLGYRSTTLREMCGVEGTPSNLIFMPD